MHSCFSSTSIGAMTTSVEEQIQLLTDAGYLTEEEAKQEAFRALLRERPDLRLSLAVERYKREEITLNRAAELAGVTTEEFKQTLAKRGVSIRRGALSEEEREETARDLDRGP